MATTELRKALMAYMTPRLKDLGFKKKRGWIFSKELGPGVFGIYTLGDSYDRKSGGIKLWPSIGVRFEIVHQLLSELKELPEKETGIYSVFTMVTYLTPSRGYVEWFATSPDEIDVPCNGMLSELQEYGIPFLEKYKTLDAAIELLHPDHNAGNLNDAYYLILIYALTGLRDRATEVLDYWLEQHKGQTHAAAEQLRTFARNFKSRLDSLASVDD